MAAKVTYYIYHLIYKGKIVYVGRSRSPKDRQQAFFRVHQVKAIMRTFEVSSLKAARVKEVQDIRRYCPRFNKRVTSAGSDEGYWKGKIEHFKGKKLSREHVKKLSASHQGKIPWNKGLKGRQVAWNKGLKGKQIAWNKGKPCPLAVRLKISKTLKGRLIR